jgi:fumarylacetoacetase
MRPIDHTHDASASSWIESAAGSDFPIQNLPFCSFSTEFRERRIGVGIGDCLLDLNACAEAGLFEASLAFMLGSETLNLVMSLTAEQRLALRHRIFELLSADCADVRDNDSLRSEAVVNQADATFHMPCDVGDYTDFYASVFHATNVGSMFRPNNPLLPNYKHIPIGYHGRASSVCVSGTPVRRPVGQQAPATEGGDPEFAAAKLLDYELEVGFYIAEGNELGSSTGMDTAEDAIFGMTLVNDWSARDLQKWEYQPLGPFLAKSFITTVSPWVITMEALAPFRCRAFERPEGDPQPMSHLSSENNSAYGGVDLNLAVALSSEKMRTEGLDPMPLTTGTFRNMYWTSAQMVAHHSSNGCNMQPGDLLASGTVSGPERSSRGCLLELTWDGEFGAPVPGTQRTPLELPTGEERKFLADGDEVIISGHCETEGYNRIGFGTCRGIVLPANQ